MPHVVRHRWLRQGSFLEPPGALSRDDAEEWLPRLRLSMHETRRQLADLSQRLRHDERHRPTCEVFQGPDHQPSRLRCLSDVWRDHRRHCEPEGSEHYRNEVDQNSLKADSDGRNPFDRMNLIVGLNPSAKACQNETMAPNAGLIQVDPKMIHLRTSKHWSPCRRCHHVTASRLRSDGQSSRSPNDLMAEPNRDQPNQRPNRPWSRPSNHPLPGPTSPKDARRLEGRLTCPSATNWKKKDWP